MPYETRKNGENVDVVNTETQEVKATHEPPDAQGKADRQVKLLHAIENDERWEGGEGDG
jgi:hypothetical protein